MSEYKLQYCEKPADYVKMYEAANSCMSITNRGKNCWELYQTKNLWPSIFYHYVPNLTGVILIKGSTRLARGFVYGKERIGPIYAKEEYGRWVQDAYGGSRYDYGDNYEKIMGEMLTADGYKTKHKSNISFLKPFYVPQVTYKGRAFCPFPRLDFIKMPLYISYDAKNKRFKFSSKAGDLKVRDCYKYSIWLTVNAIGSADNRRADDYD